MNQCPIKRYGRKASWEVNGANYNSEVCPFAGTCFRKIPRPKNRVSHQAGPGKRTVNEADSLYIDGLWFGRTEDPNEHIIMIEGGLGVTATRTVKRIEPGQRANCKI
jgi:hypothetical protein